MGIVDLYRGARPIISFELSRPKTDKAAANLEKALDSLHAAGPDYVSVTFGAGGSTREGSFELLEKLKKERDFHVVAYIAGIGLAPDALSAVGDQFMTLGVEAIFVVRGDTPQGDAAFTPHPDALPHASDMLACIKERFDVCLGAAGYPEGHIEAESRDKDLEYLKAKVEAGADYIVAQFFFDNQFFFDFVDRCRAGGITVPIVPGIMPIYSEKLMQTLAGICGVTITEPIRQGLAALPADDKKAVTQFGIDVATEQCRGLLAYGVPGIHFYTMNRGKSVATIVGALRDEGLLS